MKPVGKDQALDPNQQYFNIHGFIQVFIFIFISLFVLNFVEFNEILNAVTVFIQNYCSFL